MADDSINLLDIEEKFELSGDISGTASEGKSSSPGNESGVLSEVHSSSSVSGHDAINPRRNSTGKPSPKARFEKIVPHYLRASTGSCHDFCKYGLKHGFAEKESRPWRKKNIRTQSSKQNPVVTVALGERKKATVLKQTWPHMRQNSVLAAPVAVKKEAKVVKEMALPVVKPNPTVLSPLGERKNEIVHKQMASPDRKQSPPGNTSMDVGKTAKMRKQMASSDRKQKTPLVVPLDEKKNTTVKQVASPDRTPVTLRKASPTSIKLDGHHKTIKQKVVSPSKKVEASSKDLSSRKSSKVEKRKSISSNQRSPVVLPPPVKPLSTSQSLASAKKTGKAEKATKSVSHRSSFGIQRTPLPKSSLSVSTSQGLFVRGKGRDNVATSTNKLVAKASAKKVSALPIALPTLSISKNVALKGKKGDIPEPVPSLSGQHSILEAEMGKPENDNVPEKTLHIVVTEPESYLSESTRDDKVSPPLAPESLSSPGSSSICLSSSLSPTEDGGRTAKLGGEVENGEDVKEVESAQEVKETDDSDGVYEQEEAEEEEEEEMEEEDEEYLLDEVEEEDGEYLLGEDEEEEVEEDEDGHADEEVDEEVISGEGGKANNNGIKAVVGDGGKTLRKGRVISESKDAAPVKLKFRRGRVVDLQSESGGPRRLRFRRARVMDESRDHASEIKRRIFKKKGADGDESVLSPSDEKVVLRRQDAQGKKDAQGLFNNVIEETASKLVETRKSKVKALVGAFETVISLQDTKPSQMVS